MKRVLVICTMLLAFSAAALAVGGEDPGSAVVIGSLPYSDSGILGSTDDCTGRPYKDVFYTFTAPFAGTYSLNMCGSDRDTHVRIWSDGTCGTVLADKGDGCGDDPALTLALTSGQQIWIECGNRYSSTVADDYNFNLSGPPAGDVCGNALPISVPDTKSGNTCNFNADIDVTCDGTGSAGTDVVYAYTSPTYQRVTFSLCGSGYNTKLYIFDGSCTGTPLACNENSSACGTGSTKSYIGCLWLEAGHTYYIVVDGKNREDGGEAERCDCGNYCLTTVLCGEPPFSAVDLGDLPQCNYPTLVDNPGHGLSGIAWLGDDITGETVPNYGDNDGADDGVEYLDRPWTPCQREQVRIKVTAGNHYAAYADTGGKLYLNGWKDGNLDGDFCDDIECSFGMASEWIVQDLLVTPSLLTLDVLDPGITTMGVYDGVFRWRLTHAPVGREGFGAIDRQACPDMACGTFGLDYLGEVEDYIIPDMQLFVELDRFDAVPGSGVMTLRWNTLSESRNDRFEIARDGLVVRMEPSAGSSAGGHSYQWVDESVEAGVVYTYTLTAVDVDGGRRALATAQASLSVESPVVNEYALYQNYPNPFNPVTQIAFDLVESGRVTLRVYNLTGQVVATLINGNMESGRHEVRFDATGLPSGVYLYKLEANSFSAVHKMLLTK